jgi:hypothetical protein
MYLGLCQIVVPLFLTARPVKTQSDSNLEYDYNELLENEDFLRAIRIASQPDLVCSKSNWRRQ